MLIKMCNSDYLKKTNMGAFGKQTPSAMIKRY
jgi:hypothetical protein